MSKLITPVHGMVFSAERKTTTMVRNALGSMKMGKNSVQPEEAPEKLLEI